MTRTIKSTGSAVRDNQSSLDGSEKGHIVRLCDVRRMRQRQNLASRRSVTSVDNRATAQCGNPNSCLPDLAAIARDPSYATRRRRLADAMAQVGGMRPADRIVDHLMIMSGLAAGHGGEAADPHRDDGWPLGSGLADPAVVVGLVLHHLKQGGRRGLPIPRPLRAALDHHVAAGNATAQLVRDWLSTRAVPGDASGRHGQEGARP